MTGTIEQEGAAMNQQQEQVRRSLQAARNFSRLPGRTSQKSKDRLARVIREAEETLADIAQIGEAR